MGTHLALSAEARIMIEAPALAGPRAACNPRFCARTSRRVGLAGEIVFADGAADMPERRPRLALGVQCLAPPAGEILRPQHRIDDLGLVVLGDPRETHDLPRLLRQHVADEIAFVQPVHDQDDGARELVVQSAVEGVVVPVVRRLALGL